ncbi:MAG: hypothetical protein ACYC5Y_06235 [Symbiobacteriia bacterium]
MRFFLAPLASFLSLAVFWTAWRGSPSPAQNPGGTSAGIAFALGLAVAGLLLGWQALKATDDAEPEDGWRGQALSRTRRPWALTAIVVGLLSLVLQVLVLATPLGLRLPG